jgi:phospholipase C
MTVDGDGVLARAVLLIMVMLLLLTQLPIIHASSTTTTPIQHLIVIMQENHSFDNYFGTYPTANGTLVDSTTTHLRPVNGLIDHVCLPYQASCVSPHLSTSEAPTNPEEGQLTYQMDYANNGSGFANNSGPQSMIYFDYHSVAAYWDYAEEYGIGDEYFSSTLSTTTPNRLTILGGDTPVSANYGPPPFMSYSKTVMRQLDESGVSWGYYDYISTSGEPLSVYPLNYLSDVPSQATDKVRSISDLFEELGSGSNLPSVSIVNSLGDFELTEHPPFNPTIGERWVVSIVNRVMESSFWPTTAIFITWDEGGGYYDHVVPPSKFMINHGFTQDLVGLGQRVPLLVISPYSKENFVSNTLLSHLSLLHFIEYNWLLPPLDELAALSNLPLDFFNFSQAPRAPIILGAPGIYPIPSQLLRNGALPGVPFGFELASIVAAVILLGCLSRRKMRRSSSLGPGNDEMQRRMRRLLPSKTRSGIPRQTG